MVIGTRFETKPGSSITKNSDAGEEDWSAPGDDVYDHFTFDTRLLRDLRAAKYLVLIESPYLSINRILMYEDVLLDLTRRGVRVCVFTEKPRGWANRAGLSGQQRIRCEQIDQSLARLRKLGVHATLRKRLHVKSVIIDCTVLYRGSLNPLSFGDTIEEMVRRDSAVESMRTIKRRRLHQCSECEVINMEAHSDLNVDIKVIGAFICMKHTRMQITQGELASRANVARSTVTRLEKGERLPPFEMLYRIYAALGYKMLVMPEGGADFIPEIMRIAPLNQRDNLRTMRISNEGAE